MSQHLRILAWMFAITLLLLPQIAIATLQQQDNVLVIAGEDDLAAAAKAHPFLAVKFYVPWCEHCKALAPEWAKAAADLKKKGSSIVLATVNGEEQPNFALNAKFNLKAFPTIKIFQNEDIEHSFNYTGPRTSQGIVQYLEQHAQAAPRELKSKKEIETFLAAEKTNPAIIAFIDSQPSHSAARVAFVHMADRLVGEIVAAYVTDPSLLDEHKCPSPKSAGKNDEKNKNINADCDSPFAIMFKPNEPKKPRYQGDFTLDLLIKWAESHATPLVARYFQKDQESLQEFFKAFHVPLPQVVVAFKKARDINKAAYDAISAAAEANDDLKFTVTSQDQGEQLLKSLGVAVDAPTPLFFIFDARKNEKYLKTGTKLENLPEFLEEYKVGALTPFEGVSQQGASKKKVQTETVEEKNQKSHLEL